MSEDQVKAFVEKMKSDEAFRAKVMAEEDVEARMTLIGAAGFDCSDEEIAALLELGEAQLSGAVGGGGGSMSAYREEHTTSMGFKWACLTIPFRPVPRVAFSAATGKGDGHGATPEDADRVHGDVPH